MIITRYSPIQRPCAQTLFLGPSAPTPSLNVDTLDPEAELDTYTWRNTRNGIQDTGEE